MKGIHQRAAYLLYSAPVIGARSGHVAFIVTKPGFTLTADNFSSFKDDQVAYYCSMYPNPRPSLVKKLVKSMSTKSLNMIAVTCYSTDVVMRGFCRDLFNKRTKSDSTTEEHLAQIEGLDEASKRKFFMMGHFSSAVKLPSDFDIDQAVASLEGINENKQWTAFAPAARYVTRSPEDDAAHNCSSALVHAFKAGGIDVTPSYALTRASTAQRNLFWVSYAVVALACMNDVVSNEANLHKILLLPLVYALFRWGMAVSGAKDYYDDIRQMHPTPDDLPMTIKVPLSVGLFATNSLSCLHTPNAASLLFQFPVHLYRRLLAQAGTEVIHAKPQELQQQEMQQQHLMTAPGF